MKRLYLIVLGLWLLTACAFGQNGPTPQVVVGSSGISDGSVTNAKLAEPVSIANGGTGKTTAAEALAALGGASLNGSSTVEFKAKSYTTGNATLKNDTLITQGQKITGIASNTAYPIITFAQINNISASNFSVVRGVLSLDFVGQTTGGYKQVKSIDYTITVLPYAAGGATYTAIITAGETQGIEQSPITLSVSATNATEKGVALSASVTYANYTATYAVLGWHWRGTTTTLGSDPIVTTMQ